MKVHANAPLGPKGRLTMVRRVVEQRWSLARAAAAAGVSERTCSKWVARYRGDGPAGLLDRSSVPRSVPHRTREDRVEAIAALRRLRMTAAEIAIVLGMPLSTVSAVLARIGLGKLSRLEPPEPANRYERARPGELVHVDVKKLGRIPLGGGHKVHGRAARSTGKRRRQRIGYAYLHTAIDDYSRLAYTEVLADEAGRTAAAFWRRADAWFRARGVVIERVMTDNHFSYRGILFNEALAETQIIHKYCRPYRPQTNGKVERFHRTLLEEWAYARPYSREADRTRALAHWLHRYNHHRVHTAVGGPPLSRVTNLPREHT